jgi:HTH-type transcriptional regulator, sugar sensing transcriptional regulator
VRRGVGHDEEAVSRLQQLGLNLYESRAYLALVRGGQLSAKAVGQLAIIPQSRTYDTLESLRAKGFVMSTPSIPKLYTALPFERILATQYASRKEDIQARISKAHEEAQQRLDRLTDAYTRLREELGGNTRSTQSEAEPVWVLEGRENIERMVVSLIQGARKELMRITRPPDLVGDRQFDPFYLRMANWRYVGEAADRGVRVRWLSLTKELPSYPGLKVTEPPERRYFEREEDLPEKFVLADRGNVVLNLYDPRLSAFGSMAMMMRSETAYAVFREHFEAMWEKAEPLTEVLPKVKEEVRDTCTLMRETGYGRPEIHLYQALAQAGASTYEEVVSWLGRRRLPEAEASNAFGKLVNAGIVHKNKALGLYMVENPLVVMKTLKDSA